MLTLSRAEVSWLRHGARWETIRYIGLPAGTASYAAAVDNCGSSTYIYDISRQNDQKRKYCRQLAPADLERRGGVLITTVLNAVVWKRMKFKRLASI